MNVPESAPRTIAMQRIFKGRVFNLRSDEVRWNDGAVERLDIVEHRGSVAIVALTADGALVLVRQYRHAAARFLWEIPAGVVEPSETPIDGARRELAEETGYRAGRVRALGGCYVTPGYCDEFLQFVLAEDLTAGHQNLDQDERIAVACFSPAQALAMTARGEIADAKTLLAIAWLQSDKSQLLGIASDT
ncbi:MAG TPA: NUDIX hydrolase [Verrucomicrobiae bacterium]|jgi:ADP-ribose pyrophosphatase|nr:NUDIX hydrolase [Verrucomicrobiae bacterium]